MLRSFVEEAARLDRKIERIPFSGCWIWLGALTKKGYGVLTRGTRERHKALAAHRYFYALYRGSIPDGLQLDHLCRVRCCVNPWHLEAVSLQENVARSRVGEPQRKRTHCPRGHAYAGYNLTYNTRGSRICRTCRVEWTRRWRAV